MPVCIADSTLAASAVLCRNDNSCKTDIKTYGVNAFSAHKSLYAVGLSKDGHIIYGPYNDEGYTWTSCDVDICNGRMIDGYYSYVTTTFHPYFMGCFGPGNYPSYSQQCSSNARVCSAVTLLFSSIGMMLVFLFLFIIE